MTNTDQASDLQDQARHILQTTPTLHTQYGIQPLDETEADRAVAALAAAGLLREHRAGGGRTAARAPRWRRPDCCASTRRPPPEGRPH